MNITSIKHKSLDSETILKLKQAVTAKKSVSGLTHNYYRYPARFSPQFAREIIKVFSNPGDVILDPFMGGGTSLVEAFALNRNSIGFDVSPIADFVTKAKTTLLNENDLKIISEWEYQVSNKTIKDKISKITFYDDDGYLNNLPWNIKKSVEVILDSINLLDTENQKVFARCALLRTAQWAIDCRKIIPSAKEFRNKFSFHIKTFIKHNNEFSNIVNEHQEKSFCISINASAETINQREEINSLPHLPKLVLTSPPYVGVQILYHQWQVQSRKRTRTPFWIIDALDGQGSPFYTFGHYKYHSKKTYFEIGKKVFTSIHSKIDNDAIVAQLVGFSDAEKFLPKYLKMMNDAGYEEVSIITDKLNRIKRIWRNVPNRKWYVTAKEEALASKEVLLIHKKVNHGN